MNYKDYLDKTTEKNIFNNDTMFRYFSDLGFVKGTMTPRFFGNDACKEILNHGLPSMNTGFYKGSYWIRIFINKYEMYIEVEFCGGYERSYHKKFDTEEGDTLDGEYSIDAIEEFINSSLDFI